MVQDRINGLARRVPVWAVWLLGLAPAVWTFYLGLTGGLGAEPIKALERELGEVALQLVILGLCITPLRRYLGVNLIRFRRAVGLLAFTYVSVHLLVWLVLDVQIWAQIWADILKRPYVTVGFTAFLLMIPLALTSNDLSLRRLGPRWRVLHRLTYGVAVLGAVHFIWLSKGFQIEPLVYLAVILALLGLRWRPTRQSRRA
ncbi:MAG: protein-methionine-sulfoxide reductase heme-binding subunit MsrQ [Roseovarius sp.]|uniref:protein-methionine-sulfoxide reductase heme-binding subunit MsrQ n=1 Tax=Roseovarius sp. TaxID=1486281 RepID=UPI001B494BA4|nr:protein-methionine-sulfoxide reductase heme-binding subunit MsrQ [Roseovarius sp.]MBQ0749342.1 protein-methionine-sulfoxide reductase heme-binding subunit MsrQ [Roseovarius sp.]MBQ0809891.1 protein-methionine-sulfoxide reductase heme-binding subunit MsrQ [Roseovarius sp.]